MWHDNGCIAPQVSDLKSVVDEQKGAKLDEISAVVNEINKRIKDKKSVLAPKIKELRGHRQAFEELSNEHAEAQAAYLRARDAQDAQLSGLDRSVGELQSRVNEVRVCPSSRASRQALHLLQRAL